MLEKNAKDALQKRGSDTAKLIINDFNANNKQQEKIASVIEKVSEEEMKVVKDAQMVGEGMAIGYQMGVEGSIKEASDRLYTTTFGVIAKVAENEVFMKKLSSLRGEKYAEALAEQVAVESGENPEEEAEIDEEIAKGVAPVVIEAAGGEDAVAEMAETNPEGFQEVVETIEAITEQVKEEIMQGDAPVEDPAIDPNAAAGPVPDNAAIPAGNIEKTPADV